MPTMPAPVPASVMPTLLPDDKASKAAELQARIQSKLAIVGLGGDTGAVQSGYLLIILHCIDYLLFIIHTCRQARYGYIGYCLRVFCLYGCGFLR